jgi:ubiquinone/menaquinone biosynthesis C-methylase UbiE
MPSDNFIRGARFRFLTPSYDRLSRLVGLGERFRAFEVRAVGPLDGKRVLDVGCGTGALLVALRREAKPARLVGVDPDPDMLAQAEPKLRAAGVAAELLRGSADALPFPDGSFDVVVSSLMFHHLDAATKRGALREWRRVLAPGGALVLVDFGAPRNALLRVVSWPLGLFEHVADNLRGRIPALLDEAGFACREVGRYGGVVAALAATPRASTASGARSASKP